MQTIDILPGNNTTKRQLQSMLGALLGVCHKISATVQKKFQIFTSMKCQLLSISQVSCLEMLGTYSIAGVHETVKYCKCHIHDLYQVWLGSLVAL